MASADAGDEIDLTAEDDAILDAVWTQLDQAWSQAPAPAQSSHIQTDAEATRTEDN